MISAYYNENEPKAAAWLRELIKAGHIAPGEVDERSIVDIRPSELAGFVQCHFFAGIGVWSYALRRAGWPDNRPVWTGSCPCQPFSSAGKGGGFDDERHLWPAWYHLIGQRRPAKLFGEQVASKNADVWVDLVQADLEALGYAFGAVPFPSAGVGAPHIRDRTYWLADAPDVGLSTGPREQSLRHGEGQSERPDGAGRLADTVCDGARHDTGASVGSKTAPDSRDRSLSRERLRAGVEGASSRLDDATSARHAGAIGEPEGNPRHETRLRLPDAGCEAGGVADTDGGNASAERQQRSGEQRQQQEDAGTGGMGDTIGGGRQSQPAVIFEHEDRMGTGGGQQIACVEAGGNVSDRASAAGPTNGIWRDADWLFCRDDKWRPVEPGTFPLAHGAPARVGRLRGYGNAINAEAAKVFIEACLDTEGEPA